MIKIKFFVAVAASSLFLSPAFGSLSDGNASIGCNLQHGANYNEIADAEEVVAYVVPAPKPENTDAEAKSVE